ncbi:protein disulfide oxidoreductase [Halanaeroarchaeum sulfurireducens]|uniref:Glutaredoxin-like domain protein n=1 Tax=Halanaeroarchaeum sulfurireducens TaxID=1604004 RepID=A0A0F7P5U2_9EURY|nr:thioredoxin family protein [Halanaeroarchaeum sulfurireducens]AKH96551.1 glutaredoxin-like domain protein [Halanaeroarchaeum sulfurireducens]ALG80953.1 glutaredoxin-like domain protein [Halanaeroarchaeum sulfurireducens]
MAILSDQNRGDVEEVFAEMTDEVTAYVFTDDCEYCEDTVELNEELAELSDLYTLEVHDLDSELAEQYDADRYGSGPVTILTDGELEGVQYFGIPSGQEFGAYVRDIVAVSTGETGLDDDIKAELAEIDEPVNIKVFVTLTCPHCPRAVETAHKFAMENDNITSEMVEAQEYMELSQEFGVQGVPQVNINDHDGEFTGAQPEPQFLEQVKNALN